MDYPIKPKEQLFEKLKAKGLFWSYSPGICYDESKDDLLMETTLKYAELDDIKVLFTLYGQQRVRQLWKSSFKMTAVLKNLITFWRGCFLV